MAGSTVGVTSTQITIDVTAPFSGYLGPIADQVYQNAVQVWQNEINAQGGIHGRKIRLVKVDNQYTPAGAVAACKKAEGDGTFMVVNLLGFALVGTVSVLLAGTAWNASGLLLGLFSGVCFALYTLLGRGAARANRVLDVGGKLVTPGLIDLHCHVYPYGSAGGRMSRLLMWR